MKETIERARAGDEDAFVRLIEEHKQSLYKIARSFFTCEMDAEDAVAQTDLDCWEKLDTLQKPQYFKSWLTRILINNCNDIIHRRERLVVMDELPEQAGDEDASGDIVFNDLMAALSPPLRPVMELYYGEGFKAREIAALLNIPLGTVTARLRRGRQQLAALMEKGETVL
ncbi:MAG: sigma-70 family RNA polymerase sigma factor [Oscillospiraceae bacterium]|nr:sigma-70 family RNA polymerase sigma factor [Oscillospiraceae bacterium]